MTKIESLLKSPFHVFTVQDLAVIWRISNREKLWGSIRYYLRTGRMKRIHRGLYVVGPYTSFEVAQKLITPSYVSFYSALAAHGIIFQLYETVHSMAQISKNLIVGKEKFAYHKLKDDVFFNMMGIEDNISYHIAGPERAVCDSLYLTPGLAFDNLSSVDLGKLRELAQIYHNQRLVSEIEEIIQLENQPKADQPQAEKHA